MWARKIIISLACALFAGIPAVAFAEDVELAQRPLFTGSPVGPNLLFLFDDSGSMKFGFMPDDLVSGRNLGTCENSVNFGGYRDLCGLSVTDRKYLVSSYLNKTYYDPEVTYTPPVDWEGNPFPNANFNNAWVDGYAQSGATVDLSTDYRALMSDYYYYGTYRSCPWFCPNIRLDGFALSPSAEPSSAFYYKRKADPDCGDDRSDDCYEYVEVGEDERQNFANWFSYYRNRAMAAKAGVGSALNGLPEHFRLGWGAINGRSRTVDGAKVKAITQGVRKYDENHRKNFYNWLYGITPDGGTPLRTALEAAGAYYEGSLRAWSDNPASDAGDDNPARECRQAFTILMTDGYYDDSEALSSNTKKADDSVGPRITNEVGRAYQYKPVAPFVDDRNATTLADVAMYYWKRDLQGDIPNYVPVSGRNPAFWQHMVTYGIGLGVAGSVVPETAFSAIDTGGAIAWWSGNSNQNKINDLLHAAVNSRGGFFSAADPQTFAAELTNTVADIVAEAGSSTAVEFNVSAFQEGALIFAAQFDPNGWSGDLKAAKLGGEERPEVPDMEKAIEENKGWSAKSKLDGRDLEADARTIITYAGGKAVSFSAQNWAGFSAIQKADLGYDDATKAEERLAFIRGDRSREEDGYRKRASRLGSIVNSSPEYVGAPDAGWPDSAPFGESSKRYSAFVSAQAGRTPTVYVGSNDGMLHGFKATEDGGNEVLAYIPEFVYSSEQYQGLHYLTDPQYQHRYYVDLSLRQQDVYTKGRTSNGGVSAERDWRTILIGGGRAGAKGIFALDVTDPSGFSEDNAGRHVMWEFTAADDDRLGYVIEPPVVALARWGEGDYRWTVFLSNGYNSSEASTGFFMLDIEGGLDGHWTSNDYKYIEFDGLGGGLSPLTVLDTVGDYLADRMYAGDLEGNLWVATDNGDGDWAPAYLDANQAIKPLVTVGQPITAAPAVGASKTTPRLNNVPNLTVYFGTGQYLEEGDVTDTSTRSMYGVWDNGSFGLTRTNLIPRILTEGDLSVDGIRRKVRYSTGEAIDFGERHGWYADLPDTGERIVVSPQLRGQFLYVNSMVPRPDPCAAGGDGWLMAFGLDGRTPSGRPFLDFPEAIAGYQTGGLPNQSTILGNFRFTPDKRGNVDVTEIPPMSGSVIGAGRRGWHELIE